MLRMEIYESSHRLISGNPLIIRYNLLGYLRVIRWMNEQGWNVGRILWNHKKLILRYTQPRYPSVPDRDEGRKTMGLGRHKMNFDDDLEIYKRANNIKYNVYKYIADINNKKCYFLKGNY